MNVQLEIFFIFQMIFYRSVENDDCTVIRYIPGRGIFYAKYYGVGGCRIKNESARGKHHKGRREKGENCIKNGVECLTSPPHPAAAM